MSRWVSRCLAFLVTVAGVGCLNYTTGHGIEHHRAVAAENGWPMPSFTIYLAGVVLVVVGAFSLGRSFGAAASRSAPG